jgi:hypothetical protein
MMFFYLFNFLILKTVICTLNEFAKCQLNESGNTNKGLDDLVCKENLKCEFNEIMING